jgi:hypothetical protein
MVLAQIAGTNGGVGNNLISCNDYEVQVRAIRGLITSEPSNTVISGMPCPAGVCIGNVPPNATANANTPGAGEPSVNYSYDAMGNGVCTYKCNEGYEWIDGACVGLKPPVVSPDPDKPITPTSIPFKWVPAPGIVPESYEYRVRPKSSDPWPETSGGPTGWNPSPNGTIPNNVLNGLDECSDYEIQVRSIKGTQKSAPSNTYVDKTVCPAVNQTLWADPVGTTTGTLNWTGIKGKQNVQYALEVYMGTSLDPAKRQMEVPYLPAVNPNLNQFLDADGLTPDTQYSFRVRPKTIDGVELDWTPLSPFRTKPIAVACI